MLASLHRNHTLILSGCLLHRADDSAGKPHHPLWRIYSKARTMHSKIALLIISYIRGSSPTILLLCYLPIRNQAIHQPGGGGEGWSAREPLFPSVRLWWGEKKNLVMCSLEEFATFLTWHAEMVVWILTAHTIDFPDAISSIHGLDLLVSFRLF